MRSAKAVGSTRSVKTVIEQSVVYGILLVMLALMILFGISTAEKGVNSLVGTDDKQALVIKSTPQGQMDVKILGKDMSGTKLPWSEQVSRNLDGKDSSVGSAVDDASMSVGTWMQAGAQKVLQTLTDWFSN